MASSTADLSMESTPRRKLGWGLPAGAAPHRFVVPNNEAWAGVRDLVCRRQAHHPARARRVRGAPQGSPRFATPRGAVFDRIKTTRLTPAARAPMPDLMAQWSRAPIRRLAPEIGTVAARRSLRTGIIAPTASPSRLTGHRAELDAPVAVEFAPTLLAWWASTGRALRPVAAARGPCNDPAAHPRL
jgi:hypothetical protein